MSFNELLTDLYYKKLNYDGINQLYLKAKKQDKNIQKDDVKEWLDKQKSYQQTKQAVGKKEYLPIYSETPYSFQLDLTFFPRYERQNKGYNTLFTAININTRYAYAYKSKSKTKQDILEFIRDMEERTLINSITCDKGKEFENSDFIEFCKKNDITLFFVKEDSHKLGIINRFHRTIKNKLSKHFIATNSVNWIDAIDDIIENYNNTFHRGIGTSPREMNRYAEVDAIARNREYTELLKKKNGEPFEVNDKVRVMRKKKLFEDKQLSKYGDEIYNIENVYKNALDISDAKGNIQRVKKSDVIKVDEEAVTDEPSDYAPLIAPPARAEMVEVNKEHKAKKRFQREGLDINDIIDAPRRRNADGRSPSIPLKRNVSYA